MRLVLKLLGCLLILTAGGIAALMTVAYEKKRIALLEGWIDLIFHIRNQIDCYLTPIGEILATTDRELMSACMGNAADKSPTALLNRCSVYLSDEARRLLTAFSREIGSSYREEQVKRCDYYMEALRRLREKELEALPARMRVRSVICLCLSAGIAILLW